MRANDRYWVLDLPGLTKDGADAMLKVARRETDVVGPSAVDPSIYLTLSLDRQTVASIAAALSGINKRNEIVQSILEEFEDWLAR